MSTRRPVQRRSKDTHLSALRLRSVLVFFMIVLSLLAARLFQLQGIDPQQYAAKAQEAGLVHQVLPAARGDIVDRNGTVLAQSSAGKMIFADPTLTKPHAEVLARLLANDLKVDYFAALRALSTDKTAEGTPLRFVYVARRVPATAATKAVVAANKAKLTGLFLSNDPIRSYPGDNVAANLVGFMKNGEGNDAATPAAGLEQSFNGLLTGRDGQQTYEAGDGAQIPLGENTKVAPVNGQTLRLTIDRDVQWMAQKLLRNAVKSSGGKSGTAIVMDVQSGQLLALADYPSFNANSPADSPMADWGSRAISNVYEPGSVQKVLTSAALIQQGRVNEGTQVVVPPFIRVQGHEIHDFEEHGTERLTLAGVIAKSSNIGMVKISKEISASTLGGYLKGFGLGQTSDLGMPGESQGLLPNPNAWSALTGANISFGQGVSVTAVQMTAAVNAIANGGVYVAPSLIQGSAKDASGATVGTDVATTRRVVSEKTAATVAQMMEMVTTAGIGTAANTAIPGYRVAGKTGTAQEVGEKCQCYDHTAVSFSGFAPADKPRFTIYIAVQHPRAGSTGSETAGPVFRDLMVYLLQKYAVAPTGTRPANLQATW